MNVVREAHLHSSKVLDTAGGPSTTPGRQWSNSWSCFKKPPPCMQLLGRILQEAHSDTWETDFRSSSRADSARSCAETLLRRQIRQKAPYLMRERRINWPEADIRSPSSPTMAPPLDPVAAALFAD